MTAALPFHKKNFDQRYNELGDQAEAAFEQWATENKIQFEPYGFTRPNIDRFWQVPPFVRKTPDYLCRGTYPFLCEVKGTGRAGHVKVKVDDIPILAKWNNHLTLWVFVYDSAQVASSFVSFRRLSELCQTSPIAKFPEGTAYYQVSKVSLPWIPLITQEKTTHGY